MELERFLWNDRQTSEEEQSCSRSHNTQTENQKLVFATIRNLNHTTKSNTKYMVMTMEHTLSSSSSEEWIHYSTVLSKRNKTTDKSSEPSLHSEQHFAKSPAESVKRRNRTHAVPLSINMPDSNTMQLQQEAQLIYDNYKSQSRIKEISFNTYQGRNQVSDLNGELNDSSNGCVVISILIANEHMVSENALSNNQIESIIDETALCWLPQVRQDCDADHEGYVTPWSAIHFFQSREFFHDCTTKAEPTTGNILDDAKLYEFINSMKKDEKCAAILYFKRHEISILQNRDANGSIFYEVIDSLAHLRNGFATRIVCADAESLFVALRNHTFGYLTQHDLDDIDSTPWDENNHEQVETDPRIFQGFVWRKSSNGLDSTPLPETVTMPPLIELVSNVECNGKTCFKLTRNFQKYVPGTKKRLVNTLSKKKCENYFPTVEIRHATEQPNSKEGLVTIDFFGDDQDTIRKAADYLKELVQAAIADYVASGYAVPPQLVEKGSKAVAVPPVHPSEQTHVDDVPPLHAAADVNQFSTCNDINEDISRANEVAASIEPTASDNDLLPSLSRGGTPKIDNLCYPSSEKGGAIQSCASLDDEIMEEAIESVDANISPVETMETGMAMPGLGPPEDDDTSASSPFDKSHVDDGATIDGVEHKDVEEAATFASFPEDTLADNDVASDSAPDANRESLEDNDTSLSHPSTDEDYAAMFPLFYGGERDKPLIDQDLIDSMHEKYPCVRIDLLTYSAGLDFRDENDQNEKEMDEAIKFLSKELQKKVDNLNAACVLEKENAPMCLELDVKLNYNVNDQEEKNFKDCEKTFTRHGIWFHSLGKKHHLSSIVGSSSFKYILLSEVKVGSKFEKFLSKEEYNDLVKKAIDEGTTAKNGTTIIVRLNVNSDSDLSHINSSRIESDMHGLRHRDGIPYEGKHAHLFRKEKQKPKPKGKKSQSSKKTKPTASSAKRQRIPLETDHTSNERLNETMRKKQKKRK